MPKDIIVHLGECILKARTEKGWARQDLYERTGVSLPHIQDIEKARTNCTCEVLYILVKALQIPGGYLFTPDALECDAETEQLTAAISRCTQAQRKMIYRVVMDMVNSFDQMKEKGEP